MKYFRMYKYLAIGIAMLIIAGLFMSVLNKLTGKNGTKVDLSHASVVKEIQALNRLETASYTIEKIVEAGKKGDPLSSLLYGDRILLVAHGKVVAGIDMTSVKPEAVKVNGKSLTITLPAPTIFGSSLDNSKTKVYDRTQGLLTRGDKDLESTARAEAEGSIRQAACESGILNEARTNAIERVRLLFQFAGFSEVNVNIPSGSC